MHFIFIRKRIVAITLTIAAIISLAIGMIQVARSQDGAVEKEGIRVPILMYHSILKDPERAGKFVVSPDTFKEDMQYLKEHGYEFVFVSDLVAYVHEGKKLPKKPVVITLDDGYLNNLTYVLPILEELDMKAVFSIVGIYTDRFTEVNDPNPNYAHFTWDDVKTLVDSKRVEIGNHSYNLHKMGNRSGVMKKRGESVDAYREFLMQDLGKLQEKLKEHVGVEPTVFAYPFGFMCEETTPILKEMGFKAALTCNEKVNFITSDSELLYHLNRFNRPSGISTESFMRKIIVK